MPIKPAKGKGQYLEHSFLARFKGKGELFRGCFPIIPGAIYRCKSLGFDDKEHFYGFLLRLPIFLIICKLRFQNI